MWVKIDDRFPEHRKVAGLSNEAFRSYVEGLCFVARSLTDGRIPPRKARQLGCADELEAAGLWDRDGDGFTVHDYLDYNPPAETVAKTKEERAKAGSKGGQKSAEVRWGKQNDKQNAKQNAKQSGKQNCNPVPVPVPVPVPTDSLPISEALTGHESSNGKQPEATKNRDRFVAGWNEIVRTHGQGVPPTRKVSSYTTRVQTMLRHAKEYNPDNPWDALTRTAWWFVRQGYAHQDGRLCGVQTFMRPTNFIRYIEEAHS